MHELIVGLLESADGLEVSQVQRRTKKVDSFVEKLERKNYKYRDPLAEVTDLTGLRIVLHSRDDCPRVADLIEDEFVVDPENSQPWGAPVEPDRFGYRRDHYVVSLKPQFTESIRWKRFAGLKAEVQVRSLILHAWAELDRRLRYKHTDVPAELQRRIYQLNARLEAVDDEIANLLGASADARSDRSDSVERGDLCIALDAYSLTEYLAESTVVARWVARAIRIGYRKPKQAQTSADEDRVAQLLHTLDYVSIRELAGLDELLRDAKTEGEANLAAILRKVKELTNPGDYFALIWAHPADIVHLLVLCRAGTPELLDSLGLGPELEAGLRACLRRT